MTQDIYARENDLGAFGELIVSGMHPYAAWRFDYNVNARMITTTTANGGTATTTESKAILATSVNVAGSASIQTIRTLRYLPGVGGCVRFTTVFPQGGKANSQQEIGIGNLTDGFFFGYQGATFGITRRRAGVDVFTAQSAWNGVYPIPFNPALGNVYQIRYQWLGFGFIRFYVLDPQQEQNGFVLVHTIIYPNTSASVSILNPTLPLFARVVNSGNNTNLTLQTPSAVAFLENTALPPSIHPLDLPESVDAQATFANTTQNHLLSLFNNTTYQSITNRVPLSVDSIDLSRSATNNVTTFRVYRVATFASALTFADVSTNTSPAQLSTTTTTLSTGNPVQVFTLASGSFTRTFANDELVIYPGEFLYITAQNSSAAGVDMSVSINYKVQF